MKVQTQLGLIVSKIRERNALVDELTNLTERISPKISYPRLYADLLKQHSFVAFEIGGVRIFANVKNEEDNLDELLSDKALTEALIEAGFSPFGRPDTGNYDRICFDMRGRKSPADAPIVVMAHEEILSNLRILKPRTVADGLFELFQSGRHFRG